MTKIQLPNRPIGPFPAMLAGAQVGGRPNYVTIGACGVVCLDPILYISLKSSHHTTQGVRESGCFSINIPSTKLLQETDFCGLHSGAEVDKSALFTTFYDASRSAPMIEECPINILCKVIRTVPVNDFEMFFGEITAVFADEDCLAEGHLDLLKVDPMILMGASYLSLGRVLGSVFQVGRGIAVDRVPSLSKMLPAQPAS